MKNLALSMLFATALATPSPAEQLATVGGRSIDRTEVEKAVASELAELESRRYQVLRDGLEMVVSEALLELEAADRKTTVEQVVETEIFAKSSEPTNAEIQALYEQHKSTLQGAPLEEVRERMIDYLKQVDLAARQESFLSTLKKKFPTVVSLRPPTVEVEVGTRVRGPADAPITIVQFSDYECPFCKRAEVSVNKVMDTYGDRVRLAYRDYPLDFHANARPAAEAAHCADAQGKFWQYHEKLMASDSLSTDTLKSVAGAVGLDRAKFDACIDNGQHKDAIAADIAAAEKAGVNGTPAFFINGRMLDGAQPFDAFKAIIDEELAWIAARAK